MNSPGSKFHKFYPVLVTIVINKLIVIPSVYEFNSNEDKTDGALVLLL